MQSSLFQKSKTLMRWKLLGELSYIITHNLVAFFIFFTRRILTKMLHFLVILGPGISTRIHEGYLFQKNKMLLYVESNWGSYRILSLIFLLLFHLVLRGEGNQYVKCFSNSWSKHQCQSPCKVFPLSLV